MLVDYDQRMWHEKDFTILKVYFVAKWLFLQLFMDIHKYLLFYEASYMIIIPLYIHITYVCIDVIYIIVLYNNEIVILFLIFYLIDLLDYEKKHTPMFKQNYIVFNSPYIYNDFCFNFYVI